MTWPDGRGPADGRGWAGAPDPAGEEPPTVVFPPVRDEPPGIPGLHYMPGSPTLLPGPHPGDLEQPPGDAPRRPWPWLAGLAAAAVLGALGVAWVVGRATDPPPRAAAPAPTASATDPVTDPATEPGPSTEPGVTGEPLPTTPAPSLSVTTPPATTTMAPPPASQPALVRVPGVVGDRSASAQLELRQAGFVVSVREVPVDSRRQDRRVLAQLPVAGTPVPAGTTVVLLVGDRDD